MNPIKIEGNVKSTPNTIEGTVRSNPNTLSGNVRGAMGNIFNGFSPEFKETLLNCFSHVAWVDENGQEYYDALENALTSSAELVSISAVYTQSGKIFDFDSLDELKSNLVVTAYYDDETSHTVSGYTLSGQLDSATSTITVSYYGKTDTFDVSITFPVFAYNSATDGKLSEMSGISTFASNLSDFSEAITESGNLELKGTNSSSGAYLQFRFDDFKTGNKSILKARFNVYSLPTASPSDGIYGFRMRLSDGSSGINFGQASYYSSMNLNCYTDSIKTTIASNVSYGSGAWHDFEIRLDKSVPSQKIFLDGNQIFSSATLSTVSTNNNSVFVISNPTIYLKTIRLYDAE